MVLSMVVEAVRGAAQEVKAETTAHAKVQRAWSLTRIICRELVGMFSGIPYALYTLSLWRKPESQEQRWHFNLLKNVRYGHGDRNLLDVYTPKKWDGDKTSLPVLMFVHGGVWASGDKALFSPIGAILAHHGIVALLVQYTLYPQVFAKVQVTEISKALTWALDNVSHYGGDSNKIHLMGHSSGAHLCGMLLWERAKRNLRFREGSSSSSEAEAVEDKRSPRAYLGLAGVYNIKEHYKYEKGRGVAALSCMTPAMNGPTGFLAMSPALGFESLLARKRNQGLELAQDDDDAIDLSAVDTENMDWGKWCTEQPPFIFLASDNDIVVPPRQSTAFHKVLQELGRKSGVTLHGSLGHDDFVCWVKGIWGKDNPKARALINDVLDIVKEHKELESYLQDQVVVSN